MLTDPRHIFAARCPHDHRPAQKRTLRELRDPGVLFYCALCGQLWTPSLAERKRAVEFAEASENVQVPTSAA